MTALFIPVRPSRRDPDNTEIRTMDELKCEHYWAPNGSYFCIHCGADIDKNTS